MKTINQTYTIKASAAKVWEALTDETIIEKWGAGPAKFDAREGGKFSLWGGDIHGINTKVVPNELLEQDWYGHENSERKYKVTFKLSGNDHNCNIKLIHADIPDDEVKDFADGWKDYYFDPIIKLLA